VKPELLEQLLHENECTYLDFKRAQYPFSGESDEVKSELLKDIIALANADTGRVGFILIGAEENRGGRAMIHGVTSHLNDHDLQQFVNTKTHRPLRFSYEVVPCDGLHLGVISVPVQDGYFYLKNHFGKLCRNIVYYRLGSSTAEKTPDDLLRRGKEISTKDDLPRLELEFAHIKRPGLIGGSSVTEGLGTTAKVTTRYSKDLSDAEIAQLAPPPPKLASSENHEYFKAFSKFAVFAYGLAPLGFRLINTGEATAIGIHVRLRVKSNGELVVLPEGSYPTRPIYLYKVRKGVEPIASHDRPSLKDVIIKKEGSELEIEWDISKALPHLPIFSEGVFFTWSRNSTIEFESTIYAENIKQPTQSTMTVIIETIQKNLTVEEVQELSERFVRSDLLNGTGRLRLYAKR
jgi:hypothetical protein